MSKKVKSNDITNAILQLTKEYSEEVTRNVKKNVDQVTTEGLKLLKNKAPVKTGKYKKALSKKTAFESLTEKRNVLYAKGGEAHLTHLLEQGHALNNGGRARAFPHFIYAEQYVKKELINRLKKK